MDAVGWPEVFRGSAAIRAGLVTRGRLRGPGYVRIFPDVYACVTDEPPDLALRSRAAALFVEGHGVLCGYSAAELHGASCGPWDAPAEVVVEHRVRSHEGLLVHRGRVAPAEVTAKGGFLLTTPQRTAYDLGRRLALVEAVVAVDRLANVGRFAPSAVLDVAERHRGARGLARLTTVVGYADARSNSPQETRLRMIIELGGLPRPEVQWVVQDEAARTAVWLDLAYPEHRIAIEYEGATHTDPAEVLRDAGRYTRLVAQGWRIYRYTKADLARPARILADVARALRSSGT